MANQELTATLNSAPPRAGIGRGPACAPPCFFHRQCGNAAEIEKQGKSLCRPCASRIAAGEFPLRAPTRDPLYWTVRDLVRQLGMEMPRPRRAGGRGAIAVTSSSD